MTDTARFADVVLPATTHFEADDVAVSLRQLTSLQRVAGRHRPRSARAAPTTSWRRRSPSGSVSIRPSSIRTRPRCWPACDRWHAGGAGAACCAQPGATVQFVDTFPTFADGRARLQVDGRRAAAAPLPPAGRASTRSRSSARRPPRRSTACSREFDPPPAVLSINPDDAAERGIVADATVRVWNDQAAAGAALPDRRRPAARRVLHPEGSVAAARCLADSPRTALSRPRSPTSPGARASMTRGSRSP